MAEIQNPAPVRVNDGKFIVKVAALAGFPQTFRNCLPGCDHSSGTANEYQGIHGTARIYLRYVFSEREPALLDVFFVLIDLSINFIKSSLRVSQGVFGFLVILRALV